MENWGTLTFAGSKQAAFEWARNSQRRPGRFLGWQLFQGLLFDLGVGPPAAQRGLYKKSSSVNFEVSPMV